MAEWIEIIPKPEGGEEIASPLAMAEWIEIRVTPTIELAKVSPLAMAEWIEIIQPHIPVKLRNRLR